MAGTRTDIWRTTAAGLSLRVRVTPKSSRDAIEGIESTADGNALKVRVRAIPDKGAANSAVIEIVAKWLGVAKRTVAIDAGMASRIKTVSISGDPAALTKTITDKLATETTP